MNTARKSETSALKIMDQVFGAENPKEWRARVSEAGEQLRIGYQIQARREALRLSQSELAKLVGTAQSVISRAEDADYDRHTLTLLARISEALGCDLQVNFVPRKDFTLERPVGGKAFLYESGELLAGKTVAGAVILESPTPYMSEIGVIDSATDQAVDERNEGYAQR